MPLSHRARQTHPFDPTKLPGLELYLDASKIEGAVVARDRFGRGNLLTNPGFEDNSAWSPGAPAAFSTAQAHEGSRSVLLARTSSPATWGVTQTVSTPAQSSTVYTISCYFHPTLFQIPVGYRVEAYDSNNTYIARAGLTGWVSGDESGAGGRRYLPGTPTNQWTRFSSTLPPTPSGTTSLKIWFLTDSGSGEYGFVDAVQLEQSSTPTPFAIGGPSYLGISDSGHSWLTPHGTWGIQGGKAKPSSLTSSRAMALLNAAATNLTLTTSTSPGSGGTAGIIFRSNAAGTIYLQAQLNQPNNTVDLYAMNNGIETLLDSVMVAVATNAPSLLSVTATNKSITIAVNGTVRLTEQLSDTDHTTFVGTYAGLYAYGSVAPTFDEFTATLTGKLADATPIGLWPDLSGKGRHATQSDTSKQPLLRSGPSPNLLPYGVATASDPSLFTGSNAQVDVSSEQSLHGGTSLMLSHLNRVPNSDFEVDASGWGSGDGVYGGVGRVNARNLIIDPSYELATKFPAAQNSTITRMSDGGRTGSIYYRTTTDGGFSQGIQSIGNGTGVTPETTYTWSIYIRGSGGSVYLQARYSSTQNDSSSAIPLAALWTRYTLTCTVPAGITSMSLKVISSTSPVMTFDIDDVQLEAGSSATDFAVASAHSGTNVLATSHSARTTLSPLDAGATYTSSAYIFPPSSGDYSISLPSAPTPTTESGPGRRYGLAKNGAGVLVEEGTVNLIPNPSFEQAQHGFQNVTLQSMALTTERAFIGATSLKSVWNTGNAGTMAPRYSLANIHLSPGITYTFSVRVWVPVGSPRVRLVAVGAGTITSSSANAINSIYNEWQTLMFQIVAGTENPSAYFQVINYEAATAGQFFYLDALQIEKKPYATTFTDGSLGTGYSYDTTTNLISNPSFETDTTGWEGLNKNLLTANQSSFETDTAGWGVDVNCTFARTVTAAYNGTASLAVTASAAGTPGVVTTPVTGIPVTPGQVYTASAFTRAASTPRSFYVAMDFRDSAGTQITNSFSMGHEQANNAMGWMQGSVTVQAPVGAVYGRIFVRFLGCVASEVHYVDTAGLFEAPNGNLIKNSDFEKSTASWTGSGLTLGGIDAGRAYTGLRSLKVTGNATQWTQAVYVTNVVYLAPNATYTASAYVYAPTGTPDISLIANASGVASHTIATTSLKNQWVRLTNTLTTGATGNVNIVIADNTGGTMTSSQSFWADAVQLVKGSNNLPNLPPTTNNLIPNPSFEVDVSGWQSQHSNISRVTNWSWVGTGSLSVTPTGTSSDSTGRIQIPVQPDTAYTASATIRLNSALAGTLDSRSRKIVWYPISNGAYISGSTQSLQADNAAGVTRLSVSFTTPSTCDTVEVRLYNGSNSTSDVVWWDAVQLELGLATTPYIDGSLGAGYSWEASDNLLPVGDQSVETDLGTWRNYTGVTIARSTTEFYSGVASIQGTADGVAPMPRVRSNGVPVVAGNTYTISAWVKASSGTTLVLYAKTGSTAANETNTLEPKFNVVATGNWQRLIVTRTVNDMYLFPAVGLDGTPASGTIFYVDAIQIEARPYATAYNSPGTAHASTSVRLTPWVLGGTSLETFARSNANFGTGKDGTYSLLVYPNTPKGMESFTDRAVGAETRVNVSPNNTYTLSAITAEAYAVCRAVDAISGTVLGETTVPTSAGSARRVLTFTTQSSTTSVRLQVLRSQPNNFINFYLDAVQLEQRDYVTPFGLGTHGGVAGYPSTRVTGALQWSNTHPFNTSPTTIVVQTKFTRLGQQQFNNFIFLIGTGSNDLLIYRDLGNQIIARVRSAGVMKTVGVNPGVVLDETVTLALMLNTDGTLRMTVVRQDGTIITGVSAAGHTSLPVGAATNLQIPASTAPGLPQENIMIFSSVLTNAEVQAIHNNTTLPSAAANRSDCVFSAFVNDPTTSQSLTAGSWQRITATQTRDKNTQSDLVILGPTTGASSPYYVDAVQVERGSSVSNYARLAIAPHAHSTQMIPITATRIYNASLNVQSTTSRNSRVRIYWYTSGSNFISYTDSASPASSTTAWTKIDVVGVAPSNATQARIVCVAYNVVTTTEKHWFDQLQITDVTPKAWTQGGTGGNLLSADDASFEGGTGGWTPSNGAGVAASSIAQNTSEAYEGNASLGFTVTAQDGSYPRAFTPYGPVVTASTVYYGTARIKGAVGALWLFVGQDEGTSVATTYLSCTGDWQEVNVSWTVSSGNRPRLYFRPNSGVAGTLLIDAVGLYAITTSPAWLPPSTLSAGKQVLQFDGTNDTVSGSFGSALSQPNTIYVVGRAIPGNQQQLFNGDVTASGRHIIEVRPEGYPISFAGATLMKTDENTQDGIHVFATTFNRASSTLSFNGRVNTGYVGEEPLGPNYVVSGNGAGDKMLQGDVAAVLVFSASHDPATRKRIENWLGKQYGIVIT